MIAVGGAVGIAAHESIPEARDGARTETSGNDRVSLSQDQIDALIAAAVRGGMTPTEARTYVIEGAAGKAGTQEAQSGGERSLLHLDEDDDGKIGDDLVDMIPGAPELPPVFAPFPGSNDGVKPPSGGALPPGPAGPCDPTGDFPACTPEPDPSQAPMPFPAPEPFPVPEPFPAPEPVPLPEPVPTGEPVSDQPQGQEAVVVS